LALSALQAECDSVNLVGQSMGGALATLLAAEADPVSAMVLLAPYLRMAPVANHLASFHRIASLVVPYVRSRAESSILDPVARRATLGAGVTTPRLLHELRKVVRLAWTAAPNVVVPTLMLQSTRDPRIARADAELAFERLGGRPKELRWVTQSAHVLSVDIERDWVSSEVGAWLARHDRTAEVDGSSTEAR
jgi:carboxylesterase